MMHSEGTAKERAARNAAAAGIPSAGWKDFGGSLSRRLWLLESARLCEEARKRTGLREFGEPRIEPVLSVLTKSLEEEAGLHSLGRFLMHVHLRDILETRLRLADAWRAQPTTEEAARIKRPVFI